MLAKCVLHGGGNLQIATSPVLIYTSYDRCKRILFYYLSEGREGILDNRIFHLKCLDAFRESRLQCNIILLIYVLLR